MKRRSHQLQNKYKLLIENSQEMVLFFDQTGKIVDCNKTAKIELGYGEEIYHISIEEVFQKAIKFIDNKLVINMKYQGRKAETVAYRKNQTCYAVELKVVRTPWLKSYHGVCMAIDISEKKKIRRELKHIKNELKTNKKIKNNFMANITHELRTPVNGIMGLTEYLLDTELNAKQVETLNIIHRSCLNMNALINDLLDFAKIGNHKLVLEQREFNFHKFIDDMISFNINRITEKGLKLIVNIADDIPCMVIGDERRLNQVLNNLFSNAIKFTAVGQIALEVVKTTQSMDEVELFFMVMDTGIGINLDVKDKLFNSFYQVDSSITRRFGGTGLGLSISRMLVEAMGGSITVDSEKDKGSTFSFTVRLGIPKQSGMGSETEQYDWFYKGYENDPDVSSLIYPTDSDYLGSILKETIIETKQPTTYSYRQEEHTTEQLVKTSIEKLKLCIEMENWEKAEETAVYMKKLMPEEYGQLSNKALQLILSIRREDYNKSMTELKNLESSIHEVVKWNI